MMHLVIDIFAIIEGHIAVLLLETTCIYFALIYSGASY